MLEVNKLKKEETKLVLGDLVIYDDELDLVLDKVDEKKVIYKYDTMIYYYLESMDQYEGLFDYKVIDDSQFFQDRLSSIDIEGKTEIDDHSIIISETLADVLGLENPIGKYLELYSSDLNTTYNLEIIGVNTTELPDGSIYTYITQGLQEKMIQDTYLNGIHMNLLFSKDFTSSGTGQVIFGGYHASIHDQGDLDLGQMVYGEIGATNDVVISSQLFEYMVNDLYKTSYTLADINNHMVDEADYLGLFNEDIYMYLSDVYSIHVSRVYRSEADDFSIYASQDLYDQVANVRPSSMDIYLNDASVASLNIKALSSYGFSVRQPASNLVSQVSDRITGVSNTVFILSIILLVVIVFMIYTFFNNIILESIKKIGILRSLGYSRMSVFYMFLIQNLMISLLSSVVLSILIVSFNLINKYFIALSSIKFIFQWNNLFLIYIIVILAPILSSLLPLVRISNDLPIKSIREL